MSLEFDYLGPYKVQRLLGRGGMGSVYLGIHSKSGDTVAIKVLATSIANQPRFRRRFAAEIDALQRLRHPNVVSLIGTGEEKGLLFYVMEYVSGQSVHELLRSKKKLPWQDAVQIAIEVATALKHAHDFGIIHRDLKPANLLLDTNGNVKLTDFGIAKLYGSDGETAVGSVIGTADYMPPEQAEGKTITTRSDLYSLGCVLFALLTGKPPFHGKSVPEVLYAVRYSPIPEIKDFVDDVPEELLELVRQLLEKEPHKRPPTALVVGNRLRAIQQALKARPSLSDGSGVTSDSANSNQATRIGNRLTSIDMDDDHDLLTNKEDMDVPMSHETSSGRALGTHERQTVVAPGEAVPPNISAHKNDPRESDLSSEHFSSPKKTKSEQSGITDVSELQSAPTSGGVSHYTPVSDDSGTRYTSAPNNMPDPERWDWTQTASAVGLVALLLASIAFAWWKLQPASADELYWKILFAAESGDDGQLFSATSLMAEFLERYPDDDRASEVQAFSDEAELIRQVRILERKAARNANDLSAVEQGFLDCMIARSRNFELGREKLTAFIELFGDDDLMPPDSRLVELARFAKNATTTIALDKQPKAKDELEEMIQSAEKSMSDEALKEFYERVLIVYGDKPWAKEHVERIKVKLSENSPTD